MAPPLGIMPKRLIAENWVKVHSRLLQRQPNPLQVPVAVDIEPHHILSKWWQVTMQTVIGAATIQARGSVRLCMLEIVPVEFTAVPSRKFNLGR